MESYEMHKTLPSPHRHITCKPYIAPTRPKLFKTGEFDFLFSPIEIILWNLSLVIAAPIPPCAGHLFVLGFTLM